MNPPPDHTVHLSDIRSIATAVEERAEREPADVRPVGHPAARLGAEPAHAGEQVEREPGEQHDARRQRD